MAQMNSAVIESVCQRIQQVGAVKGVVRGPVSRRRFLPIVEFEELAGLQVARVDSGRRGADRGDLVANPDRLQRLDGLRTDVDGGADLAQRRGRLEHLRGDPEGLERVRGSEPGEPATDNRYPAAC